MMRSRCPMKTEIEVGRDYHQMKFQLRSGEGYGVNVMGMAPELSAFEIRMSPEEADAFATAVRAHAKHDRRAREIQEQEDRQARRDSERRQRKASQ